MTNDEKLEKVLASWDAVTKHLNILSSDEVLLAIKREKARPEGPRMNVLGRLAQRYVNMRKNQMVRELMQ
jgi:hypothetical protein